MGNKEGLLHAETLALSVLLVTASRASVPLPGRSGDFLFITLPPAAGRSVNVAILCVGQSAERDAAGPSRVSGTCP